MIEKKLKIINKLGLHARATTKLVKCCQGFEARISLRSIEQEQFSDAKSIMALVLLALGKGSEIIVRAEGRDEKEAIAAITQLVNNYFDEGE